MMVVMHRSMRGVLLKSRTSAFGSATIRARALTICTRNTARCQGRKQSMRFTKIWQQGTEPVSDRSTYVTLKTCGQGVSMLMIAHRSSKSSSSRPPTTSSVLTSSNFSARTSNSHSHIVSLRLPPKISSQHIDHRHLHRRQLHL